MVDYEELRRAKRAAEFDAKYEGDTRPPFYPRHRYRLAPGADRAPFDAALQALNAQHTMKPSAGVIQRTIAVMQADLWIDPALEKYCWCCDLYDPEAQHVSDGVGITPEQAMALAWMLYHAPDMHDPDGINAEDIPLAIPDGWRFELTPPRIELSAAKLHSLNEEERWGDLDERQLNLTEPEELDEALAAAAKALDEGFAAEDD